MREKPRTTGALANVAVLERELGHVAYRLWKAEQAGEDPAPLRDQRERLLRSLDEENGRLERLRAQRDEP